MMQFQPGHVFKNGCESLQESATLQLESPESFLQI